MNSTAISICFGLLGVIVPVIIQIIRTQNRPAQIMPAPSEGTSYEEEEEKKCDICNKRLVIAEVFTLPCKHKFHKICLQALFEAQLRNSTSCPYRDCRRWIQPRIRDQVLSTRSF